MDKMIKEAMANLEKNNMQPFYAESCADAVEIVKTLINKGDTISAGGSMSLKESGVFELLKCGDYNFLDREREGITPEEIQEIYRKTFFADAYFCSSNAITQNGELYNVDGNANRVAALLFGPKSVIIIAGKNKLTENIPSAIKRVKEIAAPKNTRRLNKNTYCNINGKCVGISENGICSGCQGDDRICRSYVVCGPQQIKNRIKVIIINESLGY